ncbi:MAG: transcriptional regulator, MarR family [Thermoleophilia bacterium]|nr:transcriptional regulator, MarR family [Thermoleophilia bacterium]
MSVALSGLFAQWLRGLTINAHERLAIAHLWEHGSMTMSELGARIPLSRAAITALTDRLEALNYVVRTPDAHDRRRTVLSLTERPGTLIAPLSRSWNDSVEVFEQGFDADELRIIARWTTGLKDIAHKESATLRARRDEELPDLPTI